MYLVSRRFLLRLTLSPRWRVTVPLRASSSLSAHLHHELTSRQIPLFYDYLTPQPSHLLNMTLYESLTEPVISSDERALPTSLPSIDCPPRMEVGHHLVYFPPQVPQSQLLPDGTDTLHTPGQPFGRRLWAGGRVRFPVTGGPLLDGSRAVCIETIRDVAVKGPAGEEKVIVKIERRIGVVQEGEDERHIRSRIWKEDEEQFGQSCLIETRDLIFMRDKTLEQLEYDKTHFGQNSRIVKPPSDPEFRHRITPSRAMLFRFSALTFNAHSIHLDRSYTQDVEGYRDLLVHGPLSLTLLLSVIRTQLKKSNRVIGEIEYRNLAPLYVEEELTVCGKPKSGKHSGAWDVWIEGKDGGLAVRGTIHTVPMR